MENDYRNTKYCPSLIDIADTKAAVAGMVKQDHPKARDMHQYISKNDLPYKAEFMRAYNCKCAYCGTSTQVLPKRMFEIDHFLHEKSDRFRTKADAGYIENLVLSCQTCNRKKLALPIPDEALSYLHPDTEIIKKVFYRDGEYYIRISNQYENDGIVSNFYNTLELSSDTHRLDYLLMSMIGLQQKLTIDHPACSKLGAAIQLLHERRNMMA